VPPNLEKREGLSPWNVGETPEDENASAMRDGILCKYSRRKRIDEPGSPVRKGGVVHLRQERKDQGYAQTGLDWEEDPRNQEVLVEVGE